MKILIIGGTGHVGSFLTPLLVSQGHEVYLATRGNKKIDEKTFAGAHMVTCDATSTASLTSVAEQYEFDTVIDFPGTALTVWNVFKDKVSHVIACGSLWMLGLPTVVPTPEQVQSECPFSYYAGRFNQIQQMLSESGKYKAVFTAIMPPNICGPGKIPVDTLGGRSIEVHRSNMRGETVYLPDGPQVLIDPCDASDLAALFALAANNREKAAGQMFNAGTEHALTMEQLVKTYGKIHGVEIPITYVSWETYRTQINPAMDAWWHFYAHMCPDISKAKTLLGYAPRYTPEQALERAVNWMRQEKLL